MGFVITEVKSLSLNTHKLI